jgi:GTP-binding protein
LISVASGPMTFNSIQDVEKKGKLFYGPGTETYPGMVIGENFRDGDLDVNCCKVKAVVSVRVENKEHMTTIKTSSKMKLEEMLAYMRGKKRY